MTIPQNLCTSFLPDIYFYSLNKRCLFPFCCIGKGTVIWWSEGQDRLCKLFSHYFARLQNQKIFFWGVLTQSEGKVLTSSSDLFSSFNWKQIILILFSNSEFKRKMPKIKYYVAVLWVLEITRCPNDMTKPSLLSANCWYE